MRRTLRALSLAALAAASPRAAAAAVADSVAPTLTNFGITDCEGTVQFNSVVTSTGRPTVQIRAFDHNGSSVATRTGMGLRWGTVAHVGGNAVSDNLLSLLHFDGNATSSDTYGNNASTSGVVACGSGNGHTGIAGDDCWTWDSSGDFARINASASLNSTTAQMTLQAWIKPANVATLAPILEYNNAVNFGPHFWHSVTSNGSLYANLVDTNSANHVVASSGGFVKANVWQLVTLTYNGTTARLYHNHVEVASRAFASMPPLKTGFNLFVGRRASTADTFSGSIDEVRVLNRALSAEEVEGDAYGGVFLYRTTSTATVPFTQVRLDNSHLNPDPSVTNPPTPGIAATTATIADLPLKPGSNLLVFNVQDLVGNTRRSQIGITVIESVPDAPVSLTAGGITTTGINWSWSRGSRLCLTTGGGAGQFIGRRAATGAIVYPANATASFAEGGLTANTLYGLQVQASDAFGTSALTPAASAYTLAAAPTGLTAASVSTAGAVLSWSSTNPGYTRFEVVLSSDNFASHFSTVVPLANDLTALTTTVAGLSSQTTYFVRVRAFNGRSADTDTPGTAFTAALSGLFNTLPAAPGTLAGGALGPTSLQWSWTLVPTATSYTLQSSSGTNLAVTSGLSHTVTNLTANTGYQARLRAHNLNGSGDFGALVLAFTDPYPPTGSALASIGTSTARLTWSANGNPPGTSYTVQVSTLSGFAATLTSLSVTTETATVTGLLPASTYYARVRAAGFNGNATAFDAVLSFVTGSFGAISSTSAPPSPYAVSPTEVAVFHFDEAGGTRAADSSGWGNHLALVGSLTSSSPTFTTGPTGLGSALRFAGLFESVSTAAHSASLAGTGDLTVQLWVKPDSVVPVSQAGLVVKGSGTAESYMLDLATDSRVRFAVRDAAGTLYAVSSTQTLRVGAWTHVAGVYRAGGSASLSLYLDGTLSASGAAPAARRAATESLSIGNRRSGASSFDRPFRGDIDEVHIATVVLNAAEVGAAYAAAQPAVVTPPSPNDRVRITVPPNAFGGSATILTSSSPLTVPITISPAILNDGINSPPSGQTLVPGSVFEIVANVNGGAFTGTLGSTVTLALPYPDTDGNGLVDGTFPPIPVENLKVYTLNTAVTRWEALPSSVDTANKRVLGQTTHFSIFALFGPTGIKPDTDQVRVYPRPWKPGSGGRFDSVSFGGRTGLAVDNLTASGVVRILTLSGELVREMPYGATNVGTVIWDGTNDAGRRAASGVYFALVIPDSGERVVIKFAVER